MLNKWRACQTQIPQPLCPHFQHRSTQLSVQFWDLWGKVMGFIFISPNQSNSCLKTQNAEEELLCTVWERPEDSHKIAIWSDEKLWVQISQANKKNERYWAQNNPHYDVECKQQRGRSIMCWAELINGWVITLVNKKLLFHSIFAKLWLLDNFNILNY